MEAALHARSLLAAGLLQPLSENSRLDHRLPTAILYPGTGFVNSNTATGLDVCLYDEGRGSRSTGKERDSESGLDYFGARYYGSALGRFTSPDWSAKPQAVPYADFGNPQTLNQYAYVLNNPLAHPDADGHCCEDAANFGEQLVAVPNPYLKAAGYVVIGAAALGTAMTNPEFRKTAGDIMANAGGGGGQYGDFSKQLKIDTAGQNVTNAKTNGPSNADFVVTPGGTSVPVSQGEMEKGFTQAGFPSQPNTQTSEGGTIYDVPTSAGTNMPVRVMPGSATNGTRVVMGTKQSPRTADGVRPEQGKEKDESHIEQRP